MIDLLWRFVVISLLAFGGGQAVLPLVEHASVADTGWVTGEEFASALALTYITPGPVLIMATFIGFRAFGIGGAVVATVGIFAAPWFLATAAAQLLRRFVQHPLLRAFSRGAGPAVVGLLGVTAMSLGRESLTTWAYAAVALAALLVSYSRRIHPIYVMATSAVVGALLGR